LLLSALDAVRQTSDLYTFYWRF